jgi:hypothetical protein
LHDYCPNLFQKARDQTESELSEVDLLAALNTCAGSAPWPDGIPYSTYKKLLSNTGSYLLNLCKHSCNTGVLSAWNSGLVITLLKKEGKDTKDINN